MSDFEDELVDQRGRRQRNRNLAMLVGSLAVIVVAIVVGVRVLSRTNPVLEKQSSGESSSAKAAGEPANAKGNPERKRAPVETSNAKVETERKPGINGPGKTNEATDREREQFIKLVKQNADDPTGFEIVSWSEKKNNNREVRFRCNRVGTASGPVRTDLATGRKVYRPGDGGVQPRGTPVMLEDASITYDGEKIISVYLQRTFQIWNP